MSDITPPRDDIGATAEGRGDLSPFPPGPEEPGTPIPDNIAPSSPPADVQAAAPPGDLPPGRAVVARYGVLRSIGLFQHDLEEPIRPGTKVVVRSERGLELAEVLTNVTDPAEPGGLTHQQMTEFVRSAGPEYPLYRNGKVLRLANAQDLIDQRHLAASAHEETSYCRKEIRELNLDMKLVTVEHLLGGERIIFYFAAENRVDFRELVRRLAAQFRTRIEMRQVGARDEARLVGDFERCGRPCCCQSFLKDLKPVSMRMAKTQKATLDPSKISGRCGRLMCCLRYEDAGYEELRAHLPPRNSYVRTAAGVVGKVIDMQILTQLVRLQLADNSQVVVSNEEIKERDVPPPPSGALQEAAKRLQPMAERPSQADPFRSFQAPPAQAEPLEEPPAVQTPQPQAEPLEPTASEATGDAPPLPQAPGPQGRRRRRRHRRRDGGQADGRPAPSGQGQAQPSASAPGQAQGTAGPGQSGGRRRRRRRKRR